jgi:amidase
MRPYSRSIIVLLLLITFSFVSASQIDLLTATVADLVHLLDSGEVTSEQMIKAYLDRINENNYKGLHLRAILEIAPYESLIEQARECDAERRKGKSRGHLHGVPILVKDNIATDSSLGMNTTAGSYVLRISSAEKFNCSWISRSQRCHGRA